MVSEAVIFLINTLFGLLVYTLLLRFAMQWLRAPFRNPLGQAVTALTDWIAKPSRRVIPGWRGIDWSTLLLAWVLQWLWLVAVYAVLRGSIPNGSTLATMALLACVELLRAGIYLIIFAVLAQAILSWVSPDGPLSGALNALTFRFLAPVRRLVPPLGGTLDLSPLIVIVIAQLVLMLPVAWLERAIRTGSGIF